MANTLTNVNLLGGSGSSDLANATGVLAVAHGGTNSSTALNNNRVMQSASGKIQEAAAITASRALISDANGIPTHATTTSTEIGYVNGVTSAIQTQLDTKAVVPTIVSTTWSADQTVSAGTAWANAAQIGSIQLSITAT